MFTHTFHFTTSSEMSYCCSHLDCFVSPVSSSENEFEGDAPNEVTFSTNKPVSKAAIAKMVNHFEPKNYTFNRQSLSVKQGG